MKKETNGSGVLGVSHVVMRTAHLVAVIFAQMAK
jgi:hypothetical protein